MTKNYRKRTKNYRRKLKKKKKKKQLTRNQKNDKKCINKNHLKQMK